MKEIMLDFGAILSDLFHALRSGAKKVLIALAVLTALLTALVLYLMTPHTEIRSLTGFRCYFVPRCEVNYQSYHRDNDLYNMGIYKLNGQDAARFVYWAQENGWSPMPLSDEALRLALSALGVDVSRRVIAKYRAELNIPSFSQRKKR